MNVGILLQGPRKGNSPQGRLTHEALEFSEVVRGYMTMPRGGGLTSEDWVLLILDGEPSPLTGPGLILQG